MHIIMTVTSGFTFAVSSPKGYKESAYYLELVGMFAVVDCDAHDFHGIDHYEVCFYGNVLSSSLYPVIRKERSKHIHCSDNCLAVKVVTA